MKCVTASRDLSSVCRNWGSCAPTTQRQSVLRGGSLSNVRESYTPQGLSYENGTTLSYTSGCFLGFTSRTCHVTSSIDVVAGQLAAAAAAAGREPPQLNEMSDMPGETCCRLHPAMLRPACL